MKSRTSEQTALPRQLRDIGVSPGDIVMVHASLRKLGLTDGDGEHIIVALDRAVGPEGTLMMVLGAEDDWAWVNRRPEAERIALLADAEPFDALATPAQADIGVLAELFRCYPGTRVNYHPEGRFAARGARASDLLANCPWHDYYGPGSPLERLVAWDGKILRMGADLDTVTALHYAEYLADLPQKKRVRRYRRIKTDEGAAIKYVDCLDDDEGIVDCDEDYFTQILQAYFASRPVARGKVGKAESELIDARDIVFFARDWMERHLRD